MVFVKMILLFKTKIRIKKTLLVTGISISVIVVYFLCRSRFFYENKMEKIKIGSSVVFNAEVVNNQERLAKGLAGRKSICENCGMLFEFEDSGRHSFWMKGMEFDLDILWISKGKIVYIAKNVSHSSRETITPQVESDKVLEINAGMADKLGVKVGDRL